MNNKKGFKTISIILALICIVFLSIFLRYRYELHSLKNEIVNNKLDRNNIARQIVEKAIKENNLNTGITGINRKTGELIIMPVKVQNK